MARVKRGVTARRRHKKVIGRAKGYYNARRKVFRVANQAVIKAGQYAYIGRKQRKRQFRALWIVRINAAARMFGLSYSRLINGLSKAGIEVDRKVLADIAVHDIAAFGAIAAQAQAALGDGSVEPTKASRAAPASKSKANGDDLTRVEGVGPKIAELLQAAGINSFAELADTSIERLSEILHEAGSHFSSHDPSTWPKQAKLAAAGKFDELDVLQAQLNGGREDLTRIEGIGPKTAELLHANGITSFAVLSKIKAEAISEMLHEAGSGFASHDPTTWPQQAKLAAAGKFDELDAMQAELNGGRPV